LEDAESVARSCQQLKESPLFLPYLQKFSSARIIIAKVISQADLLKEALAMHLKFEDLRAIPFVGSWSQLKQNVPGYLWSRNGSTRC
jgi:phosphoenolpyruvate carboxylase